MITPMSVQDSLNEFISKEVASKHMLKTVDRNGKETKKHPRIIKSGWVLPGSIDKEDDAADEVFPYIVTRIESLEHIKGDRISAVTMMFFYGVYDPGVYDKDGKLIEDGSGYRDIWNLIESTRQAIFQRSVIDNKLQVVDDYFEAKMLDEQVYPYWEGYCKAKFHVLFPVPQLDNSFFERS